MNYQSLDQVRDVAYGRHQELLHQAEAVRLLRQGERRRRQWPSLSRFARGLTCRFFEPACGPINVAPSRA